MGKELPVAALSPRSWTVPPSESQESEECFRLGEKEESKRVDTREPWPSPPNLEGVGRGNYAKVDRTLSLIVGVAERVIRMPRPCCPQIQDAYNFLSPPNPCSLKFLAAATSPQLHFLTASTSFAASNSWTRPIPRCRQLNGNLASNDSWTPSHVFTHSKINRATTSSSPQKRLVSN